MKCVHFIVLLGMLNVGGCRLQKADGGSSSDNSADSTVRAPNYVSCRKDVDGGTQRCYQYDAANSNPIAIEWVKTTCGQADKGLEGFGYIASGCPTAERLGECVANHPTSVYSEYYYGPAFSGESAAKACQDSDGSWTTP